MQFAHGARVAVRKNRLWPVRAVPGGVNGIGHTLNGFGPANGPELPRSFKADAEQGGGEAIGMVGAFEVPADLAAKEAAGEWVLLIASQLRGNAICDSHNHPAGIGAVVRANAAHSARARSWQRVHGSTATNCGGSCKRGGH